MPNYDFECTNNHIFEANVSYDSMKAGISCRVGDCKAISERLWLSPRASRNALNFNPTLLYVNAEGRVICPGRNNPDHLPSKYRKKLAKEGYKELEIKTFSEYQNFQREQTAKLKVHYNNFTALEQANYDREMKDNIDFMRSGGTIQMPNEDGTMRTVKVPPLDSMEPSMRRLAEHAIEQARNHRITRPFQEPIIASMEYDKQLPNSDIDSQKYRDEDTGWRGRR